VARADIEADVAIVGAGAAGLFAALCAAAEGGRIVLVSAKPLAESASYWAQGGLAAALAADDSPELHLADTLLAGRGTVRPSAARVLCQEAPDRVRDLERLGVRFDADRRGRLALGLEGGHKARRVAHAGGSATGRRILRELSAVVAEEPRIEVLENVRAAALWLDDGRCAGLRCEDGRTILARGTVLSSGGAAALWSRTTNPPGSVGIGMLLAHRAGADLADLEMLQFHPTAVTGIEGIEGFLVTEAIRGEGATLHDAAGERFVDELAPRDEVALAILERMAATGAHSVALDMRAIDPGRFPNVVTALRDAGLDPATQLVPVAPAAHYMMGGVVTDLHGRSTIPGLYAVGECSCTGLHGANRLASNSLSECFVFGRRAALHALGEPAAPAPATTAPEPALEDAVPSWETRIAVTRCAGPVRSAEGLRPLLEDRHPLARLVAASALARVESRGAHRRSDAPAVDPALDLQHTVVAPDGAVRFERWV
jgi:L-aspartate oxidase